MRYSFTNFLNGFCSGLLPQAVYSGPSPIRTAGGAFHVRSGSQDAAIASPAFERADVGHLFRILARELSHGPVDFIDVGANIGAFSVRVGRAFPQKSLRVWASEPFPANLEALTANLALNSLSSEKVVVVPYALSDRSGSAEIYFSAVSPGNTSLRASSDGSQRATVECRRADEVLAEVGECVVLKIDVEGHERAVLAGMSGILDRVRRCHLCVEDMFESEMLFATLDEMGFVFKRKLTPYNSWWTRENLTPKQPSQLSGTSP